MFQGKTLYLLHQNIAAFGSKHCRISAGTFFSIQLIDDEQIRKTDFLFVHLCPPIYFQRIVLHAPHQGQCRIVQNPHLTTLGLIAHMQ